MTRIYLLSTLHGMRGSQGLRNNWSSCESSSCRAVVKQTNLVSHLPSDLGHGILLSRFPVPGGTHSLPRLSPRCRAALGHLTVGCPGPVVRELHDRSRRVLKRNRRFESGGLAGRLRPTTACISLATQRCFIFPSLRPCIRIGHDTHRCNTDSTMMAACETWTG